VPPPVRIVNENGARSYGTIITARSVLTPDYFGLGHKLSQLAVEARRGLPKRYVANAFINQSLRVGDDTDGVIDHGDSRDVVSDPVADDDLFERVLVRRGPA
jgi:hypothetical protein